MSLVKLGDIARECRSTYSGNKSGIPIVGLEHLTPGDIVLHSWDIDTDNTFSKSFKKGQVLLGRRRVYLKKASVAPFDGICSGDITVIEAIPEKLHPDLLPFIIQNDRFFEFAIIGSAGSLSPRVKWEYLKEYEINLPELNQQGKLVELLTSANELKHSYKEMILATDEMVKSQFIEMFGGSDYPKHPLGNLCKILAGKTLPLDVENEGGPIAYIKVADMNLPENDRVVTTSTRNVTEETAKISGILPIGATVFPKNGAAALHNKKRITAITTCVDMNTMGVYSTSDALDPEFLYAFLVHQDVASLTLTGAIPQIRPKDIAALEIPLPPLERQREYIGMVGQADKSKYLN